MNNSEKLNLLIHEHNGLVLTKQVSEAGIARTYIAKLVKSGMLECMERGVYITKDGADDAMYRLQMKYEPVVFSHESALLLYDLTDRDPLSYSVTVPEGYNAKNIKNLGVKVYSVKKDHYLLGLTDGKTIFGREIKCYDMERTICDIIRSRSQMDIAVLTDAIKRYSKRKDKNLPLLMRYAESFNVTKLLRNYLEVLL
ncbi:MAG: type IV toxin-antitoxin system AbiEi family antitoxin domain-containing protein [Saccharofermentanales bacterium]